MTAESRRITVLVNPTAGRGLAAVAGPAAYERLLHAGVQARLHLADSRESMARGAAEAIAEGVEALVVVGGDGTLSLVLDAVLGSGTPLGIIPAGTGNDLARSLGLPLGSSDQAAAAVDYVLQDSRRRIDAVQVESGGHERKLLTVTAIGFDAEVSQRTNRLRWPRGQARYYLALLIELVRLRPKAFSVSLDGGPFRSLPGILLAIANTRSYGGGMPICPEADPADGVLDITHVAPLGRLRLIGLFPLLLRAQHLARPEVNSWRAENVEVRAPGSVVVADGEAIGRDAVSLRVLPAALEVFGPTP